MTASAERHAEARTNRLAYLALTATAMCWGANAIFGRLAVGEISPMLLVSLRWLGVLMLFVVFARHHVRRDWPVLRGRLWYLGAMGAAGFTAFNGMFYVAAHSTTAVNIGIIQGAIPVFVLLGAYVVFRSKVAGLQLAGVVTTMLGVALVASGGDLGGLAALTVNSGDLLMIVACAFFAGYAVGLRKRPEVSSLGLFTLMAAAAFVVSLPLTLIEWALGMMQWPTPRGWVVLLAITLLPSFLAQLLFMYGVQMIGPGRAGIFVNLVPVFAAVLAVTFLGETFEGFHAVALGLVLGGIWLAERHKPA